MIHNSKNKILGLEEEEMDSFFLKPKKSFLESACFKHQRLLYHVEVTELANTQNMYGGNGNCSISYRHTNNRTGSIIVPAHILHFLRRVMETEKTFQALYLGMDLTTTPTKTPKYILMCQLSNGDFVQLQENTLSQYNRDTLSKMRPDQQINWTRHHAKYMDETWYIDRFSGELAGLSLVHRPTANKAPKPIWCGQRISSKIHYNSDYLQLLKRRQTKKTAPKPPVFPKTPS